MNREFTSALEDSTACIDVNSLIKDFDPADIAACAVGIVIQLQGCAGRSILDRLAPSPAECIIPMLERSTFQPGVV